MQHRGRLQVQGNDLSFEPSWPWSTDEPPSQLDGLTALANLQSQVSPNSSMALRTQAFAKAQKFIESAPTGVGHGPTIRTFQNRPLPKGKHDARVDLEIIVGYAFV